jgi:hypothetical protein
MVKFHIFLIILLVICPFSIQDEFEYKYEEKKGQFINMNGQNYINIVKVKTNKKYIKVTTSPNSNLVTATILFFKKKTDKREDALLFADNKVGDNDLFIYKELFDDTIYLNISCYNDKDCSYRFKIDESDHIELKRDGQYSYQSNKENQKNTFMISRKNEDKNTIGEDENAVMTFFVDGNGYSSDTLKMNVEYVVGSEKTTVPGVKIFTKGKIITFKESDYKYDENGYYLITVDASSMDYVTVGSRSIHPNEYMYTNHINPNDKAIDGYIKLDIMKSECFNIDPFGDSDEQKKFIINVIAYSHNIQFYYIYEKNGEEIPGEYHNITDEFAATLTYKLEKERFFCLRSLNGEDVFYNLQVVDFKKHLLH